MVCSSRNDYLHFLFFLNLDEIGEKVRILVAAIKTWLRGIELYFLSDVRPYYLKVQGPVLTHSFILFIIFFSLSIVHLLQNIHSAHLHHVVSLLQTQLPYGTVFGVISRLLLLNLPIYPIFLPLYHALYQSYLLPYCTYPQIFHLV
jgi:hypothetical protein